MKVCQIVAGIGNGGLEKHTIELSKQLKSKGLDITVIADKSFEKEFEKINFIPLDLTKSRKNIFILYRLYKILKSNNFDIIHTQANKATSMVMTIKTFLNSKFVSTLHNQKSNLSSFEKTDFVISVSKKIGEKIKNKKSTIYNGINFDNSCIKKIDLYKEFNIKRDKFIICSIARFTKVKRFDILLESLNKTSDIHLILVGSGKEDTFLKNKAKELDLESKISFTGMLDNKKAKDILSSSSLFVMTSDNEGFPYTFVESMFCNTPFLSTPVSDLKEFIGEKYIIPFDDSNILSKKLELMKNNYSEVKTDFERIFKFSQDKLTSNNMCNEVIKVYKEVL